MKKKLWSGASIALAMACAIAPQAAFAAAPTVLVDGQALRTDVPALVMHGRVLLPMRALFERLGARVDYDARRHVVAARRGTHLVWLRAGSAIAYVDGQRQPLDVAARVFAGRLEVPLRFVAQALGAQVDYDAADATVAVVTGAPRRDDYHPSRVSHAGPTVEDERPTPHSLIGAQYPQIYGRFNGGASPVDPRSVKIWVDGRDVTGSATVSSAYFAYTPNYALDSGTHHVSVSGTSDDGAPFDDAWSFQIDAQPQVGYGMSPWMAPGFGYYPPGFSLYVPGPAYYYYGNVIEVVLFASNAPVYNVYVRIGGIPGLYPLNPWRGNPGYFNGFIPVPYGAFDPRALVTASVHLQDGTVLDVRSTAPLSIDGTTSSPPPNIHYANNPVVVPAPVSPHKVIATPTPSPVPAPIATIKPPGTPVPKPTPKHTPDNCRRSPITTSRPA